MVFWYQGHRIEISRGGPRYKALATISYAGRKLMPVVGRNGITQEYIADLKGSAVLVEALDWIDDLIGDPVKNPNSTKKREILHEDLVITLHPQAHEGNIIAGHIVKNPRQGLKEDYGAFNAWILPTMPQEDALELAMAVADQRKFRIDEPHRMRSRFFYTAWLLHGRQP